MTDSNIQRRKVKNWLKCIPQRLVLYFLMLSCVMVSFIMRTVISLTILAMVKEYDNCEQNQTNAAEKLCNTNNNSTLTLIKYGGTLEWSVDVQYYVLVSFLWTYTFSQVLGGIAAQRFGTKVVIGSAMVTSSLCNLALPLASKTHYILTIILQMSDGLVQGTTWPALYTILSCWVPIHEKNRFVSCFYGLSIGTMLGNLMAGFIIASIGWEYVFYIVGSLGLLWCLLWYFLVYNTPELHPRISLDELNYIKNNREQNLHFSKSKVPWISMLCSLPMWAIAILSFGRLWYVGIVSVYGPLYLKTIVGLNIQMNGTIIGVIAFGSFVFSLIISYASDKIEIHKLITTLSNRRLFSSIGAICPALLMVTIGYLNYNTLVLLTFWSLAHIISPASFIAGMVNITDLTPNFAGPASSLVQTLMMSSTLCGTLVAKNLLRNERTLDAWRGIFNITGGVLITSYVFYFIFASTNIQKWDYDDTKKTTNVQSSEEDNIEELTVLNK